MENCSDKIVCRDRNKTWQDTTGSVEVTGCSLGGVALTINGTSIHVHQNQQHFEKKSQPNDYSTNYPSDVNFKNAVGIASKY